MPINLDDREYFASRHIGPDSNKTKEMLEIVDANSMDEFIQSTIPTKLRLQKEFKLDPPQSEFEVLQELRKIAEQNKVYRSFIGAGYYGTVTPPVIQRNILENPGWYTQYTPYQAEISQGRLEALLNFQTMIIDLTGLPIANASLLDESSAAAEAMSMFYGIKGHPKEGIFFVDSDVHPQTLAVLQTRAEWLNITVEVVDFKHLQFKPEIFGCLVQYPTSSGSVHSYKYFCEQAHKNGTLVAVAADILSLALLSPPGEFGADVALGSTQRFGIPMGYGGPYAAYFATKEEFKRQMPGRIIGVSIDANGKPALRMALQTREQHIRREKATSNICTAQVLLAIMAGMYAVYYGPKGIKRIAERIHNLTKVFAKGVETLGWKNHHTEFFDTIKISHPTLKVSEVQKRALSSNINLRYFEDGSIGISFDETTTPSDVQQLFQILSVREKISVQQVSKELEDGYYGICNRTSPYLQHPVFNKYHSETEMLRYIHKLESRDLSLTTSMIPLGSCTMKLNASVEMIPITWNEFTNLHPFVPIEQSKGYQRIFDDLQRWLGEITGLSAVSLQPNSGAQGELTGLLVIRAYHKSRGEKHRDICLIPASAHGTNPASAVMAGMEVVVVKCDDKGNVDISDLKLKAEQHKSRLAVMMITYPSTHGVFEESIKELSEIVHRNGGQVYMDGANLNAQVGLMNAGELGADVCHINLHKTFSIPHGGGGPGMGPIAVASHLEEFLPGNPFMSIGGKQSIGSVAAAPWGSANVLVISWAYIALMGAEGLKKATEYAILNANYISKKLENGGYRTLYKGMNGRVAHEFICDLRSFKESAGIEAEDVAKRLMDFGFHAPTVSFPVAGTIMIEPTESESKEELDRFCTALLTIFEEIKEIESGKVDRKNNVLKNAPHTAEMIAADNWNFPYCREKAAYPAPWLRERKFWTPVARVNNVYGDRNLVCACPPIESYMKEK